MSKPHAYAKRLIPPYTGVIQIVENENARALSMDGKIWEIQALHAPTNNLLAQQSNSSSNLQYIRVAHYTNEKGVYRYPHYPTLDPIEIYAPCKPIINHIAELKLPLKIQDDYEYWLVDEKEQKPLALICSCSKPDEFDDIPYFPHWKALSAVQIGLNNTEEEAKQGLTPPSDRLEKLIHEKAGYNPKAYWFKRDTTGDATLYFEKEATCQIIANKHFPEFLFSEDWESEEDKNLCHRYLARISPRLLMLQRLSHAARDRVEILASSYPIEVDRYYSLYPEIADKERMDVIRVEARLRRSICDQTTD